MKHSLAFLLPRKKLPARANAFMLPLVLTCFMTFVVSGIATFRAIGLVDGVVGTWFASWMASWLVAFPVMVVIMAPVKKLVGLFVQAR